MAGVKRSQKRRVQQLVDEKLARSDFQKDLLRKGPGLRITDWVDLATKYKLPLSSYGYISYYLQTGKYDAKYIEPPVLLITDIDRTIEPTDRPELKYNLHEATQIKFSNHKRGLYIQILDEATISDVENFIRDNAKLIAHKMLITRGRAHIPIRQSRFSKRDDDIFMKLTTGKSSVKEMAEKYNITPQYIRTIFSRQKAKRDTE